jgi:hypothetical protein
MFDFLDRKFPQANQVERRRLKFSIFSIYFLQKIAKILLFVKMDKNDEVAEVQSEEMEDYCRQLGLQLRDEQETSTMHVEDTSQISVLGAAQQSQKRSESGQPIPAGLAKLEATDKAYFECKKCEKNFTNSRQFLKHKCVLKSEGETQMKAKGKKRGRKPRVKTSEATERVYSGDEVNIYLVKNQLSMALD